MSQSAYSVLKNKRITAKAMIQQNLPRKKGPHDPDKYKGGTICKETFIVDSNANKIEIARAVKEIYGVTPVKVNVLTGKSKPKKKGKGRPGKTSEYKKAIVTLADGESLKA